MPSLKILPPGFQCINGRTMHVVRIPGLNPRGYHIALIHGIIASGITWLPLIKELRSQARDFLIFDMPAHGLSPAPDNLSCLDAYKCVESCLLKNLDPEDKNLIIGNSLGGAFAVKFTLENPDYTERSVFISPAGAPFPSTVHEVVDFFCADTAAQAKKIVERVFVHPGIGAYSLIPALLRTSKTHAFRSFIKSITDMDDEPDAPLAQLLFTPEKLSSLKTRSLFIWGQSDRVLPPQMRDYYDLYLPQNVQRLYPPDYGHCPQFEVASDLADHISAWLHNC